MKLSIRPRPWPPLRSAFAGFWFPPEVIVVAVTGLRPWRHRWLAVKSVITATLAGLLIGVLVPGLGRAAGGAPDHAGQVLTTIAPATAAALLVLNVVLGIAKPRLGAPSRR